ncbi:MAG: iron-containing alcohol dehydrogenase [Chloroflexi bacterium]|nr:iron-containing alcohol dehydrogenase [Chloroflexota bacterium]
MVVRVSTAAPPKIDLFRIPTRIMFGRGVALKVAEPLQQLGAKRVLVVTDPGVIKVGLVEPTLERLRDAKIAYEVYDGVVPDPTMDDVARCYERAKEMGADALVAVGGGSSIDTAKMAATLMTNGGTVLDYVGIDKVPKPAAPVVAIPTTAGTGAEITINSVIADPAQHKKLVIISPNATAFFALEDPDMTKGLPPFLTAITGMDTLVHAVESFTNKSTYPMTMALAYEAIRDAAWALPRAVKDGSDMEARERMLRAVISSSLAFSNTRLGNVHAMALPLGGWCHVAHGTAVAILLPHVMDFNQSAAAERFDAVGEAMGVGKDGKRAVRRTFDLVGAIGIPKRLSEVGVTEDEIGPMAKDAMLSGNILVNPRTTALEDVEALYRSAL